MKGGAARRNARGKLHHRQDKHCYCTTTATTTTTTEREGWIIHEHPDETSEGFGSHARGVLFPLIHIAEVTGLEPLFSSKSAFGNNTARDYSSLDVTSFFDLRHKLPFGDYSDGDDETKCEVLTVNTWTDRTIGSACGDGKLLASYLKDHLQQLRRRQGARADDASRIRHRPFIIRLVGALRYMDPTPQVYQFLQGRSLQWKGVDKDRDGRRPLRVAVHVRVPEDFCPKSWKDDNHISKLFPTLEKLKHFLYDGAKSDGNRGEGRQESSSWELSVYTEERFSLEDERLLKQHYPAVNIHRGNCETLLCDVKCMSTADIFIASSSHLSALVGYLTHGLVVLSDASRWEYFRPHKELGCQILDINNMDSYTETLFKRVAATTRKEDNIYPNDDSESDDKHPMQGQHNKDISNLTRSRRAV